MTSPGPALAELQKQLIAFAASRDWLRWHSPKNLALALAAEVGELCQLLRWDEGAAEKDALASEMADIAIFLLYLGNRLDIDLAGAILDKIRLNEDRFPRPGVL
jgi:dCTP diphosphatase